MGGCRDLGGNRNLGGRGDGICGDEGQRQEQCCKAGGDLHGPSLPRRRAGRNLPRGLCGKASTTVGRRRRTSLQRVLSRRQGFSQGPEAAGTVTPQRRIPVPVACRPAAVPSAAKVPYARPSKPRNLAPRPRENRPSVQGRCSTLGGAVCCALTLERRDNSWMSEPARLIQGCGGTVADYAYPALLKRSLKLQMRRTVPPAVRSFGCGWEAQWMPGATPARANAKNRQLLAG